MKGHLSQSTLFAVRETKALVAGKVRRVRYHRGRVRIQNL